MNLIAFRTSVFLLFLSFTACVFWSSCVPKAPEEIPEEVAFSYQDSLFQLIVDFQDLRKEDSLFVWLTHKNPNYRYLAARAFASIQSPTALEKLAPLLKDPIDEVRAMAAFAIGQTGGEDALPYLIKGFIPSDTALVYKNTQRSILEAVGKCGDIETLIHLSTVAKYEPRDTALIEGQIWGIYRFGLNGITAEEGTNRALELIASNEYSATARLVAANYLSRMAVPLDSFAQEISTAFVQEKNANIRMALAIALGKTKQESALNTLLLAYGNESDYRVKCNTIRALTNFPYENGRSTMLEAIRETNEHVALRAVQYLLEKSTPTDATLWWKFAKDSLSSAVQTDLYRVANRHLPVYLTEYRDAINAELRQQFNTTSEVYKKAATMRALGEFAWNFKFIHREGMKAEQALIRSTSTEVLMQISEMPNFNQFFNASSRRVKRELAAFFLEAIRSGDPGQVALAAQALRSEKAQFKPLVTDSLTTLKTALEVLELPAMIESYNELAETIAYLEESSFEPEILSFNHPIDWKQLERLGESQTVQMKTNKGDVILELWPNEAPGTVANFLSLANKNFFDNKAFHRVVPNFVVQGGCPRGDGYGSLDYSIRSEFSPVHYLQEGILGMASAGKDTEGTQFFITHSPTIHLDGRYTAFGRVTQGMDIVHEMQIGDKIIEVIVL